jgi:aspartyl-tRNA(Asn)/glutamyl-tRNA(Gln) amidotransferase subunit C
MEIDDKLIEKLETLSKLKLSDDEKHVLKGELGSIMDMFADISSIDTTGVEPLRHITDAVNVMREDIAHNELTTAQGLSNAPKSQYPYFAVPKVIE